MEMVRHQDNRFQASLDMGDAARPVASSYGRSTHDATGDDRVAHTLLDSLAQGNSCAFWELWGLHQAQLYQICLSHMVGVREDAEDALSRSMLRALDKLPHVSPQIENVKAWLIRLTLNLCADMHRERKRRTRRLEQMDDGLAPGVDLGPREGYSPEELFLSQEGYTSICEAIDDLPDRLREPFALRFFQEMAYVDIAERLMLTNENVRKRIQQARDILKRRLTVAAVADGVPAWRRRSAARPGSATGPAAPSQRPSIAAPAIAHSQSAPAKRLSWEVVHSTVRREIPDGWQGTKRRSVRRKS
jgi:RNA polymerase sigma factor (sigma-70 family)